MGLADVHGVPRHPACHFHGILGLHWSSSPHHTAKESEGRRESVQAPEKEERVDEAAEKDEGGHDDAARAVEFRQLVGIRQVEHQQVAGEGGVNDAEPDGQEGDVDGDPVIPLALGQSDAGRGGAGQEGRVYHEAARAVCDPQHDGEVGQQRAQRAHQEQNTLKQQPGLLQQTYREARQALDVRLEGHCGQAHGQQPGR